MKSEPARWKNIAMPGRGAFAGTVHASVGGAPPAYKPPIFINVRVASVNWAYATLPISSIGLPDALEVRGGHRGLPRRERRQRRRIGRQRSHASREGEHLGRGRAGSTAAEIVDRGARGAVHADLAPRRHLDMDRVEQAVEPRVEATVQEVERRFVEPDRPHVGGQR